MISEGSEVHGCVKQPPNSFDVEAKTSSGKVPVAVQQSVSKFSLKAAMLTGIDGQGPGCKQRGFPAYN